MFKLLLKDVRLTRLFWLPILAVYIVFHLIFTLSPASYFFGHVFFALLLSIVVPGIEYMSKTDHISAALPVRRAEIVGARYLETLAVILVFLGLFLSTSRLARVIINVPGLRNSPLPTIQAGLALCILTAVLASLFFLFYFRSGMGKGLYGFSYTILFALIFSAMFSMHPEDKLAAGRMPAASGSTGSPAPGFFGASFLGSLERALGNPVYFFLSILATAAIVIISLRLSIYFYKKRDI